MSTCVKIQIDRVCDLELEKEHSRPKELNKVLVKALLLDVSLDHHGWVHFTNTFSDTGITFAVSALIAARMSRCKF